MSHNKPVLGSLKRVNHARGMTLVVAENQMHAQTNPQNIKLQPIRPAEHQTQTY